MPSTTTTVGGIAIPVTPGALNARLSDTTVDGLLDYIAYWLGFSLDAALAQIAPTSPVAVPTRNRFPFDPGTWHAWSPDGSNAAYPALYLWWGGVSRRLEERETLVWQYRERVLHLAYIFEEQVYPTGASARSALMSLVDATLWRALDRGAHPSYSYGGGAPGVPISITLGLENLEYRGSQRTQLWQQIPSSSPQAGGSGEFDIVRGCPALEAQIIVWERIGLDEPSIDDALGDTLLTINGSDGESKETVEIMQRWLPSPDGSEE